MEVFEKSQTIDPEVRAYVYSLVSAIGGSSAADDGRYVLGDDALACLKDLRRWLKLYDTKLDRFDVKRCLSEANLVKGDLLEILGQWKDEDQTNVLRRKVAVGSLELLTELTWPLQIDPERTTVNHLRHLPVIQLAQVDYKRAILHHPSESILRKAIAAALPALMTARRDRSPREEGMINLVLYLFRNVAVITHPSSIPTNGEERDISRSETVRAMQEQDVLQLVLTICSGMGDEFDEQDVIVLEILFHLLKGVDPTKLFKNEKEVRKNDATELKNLLRAEKAMLAGQARNAPSRHNRFGTMIWVKQGEEKVSTVTGQEVLGNDQKTFEKMDASKKWNRPKHHGRKPDMHDGTDFAPAHLDQRAKTYLQNFVAEFLDSSFNPLFVHLRRALEREADRVKEDHSRQYFYLVSWFLEAEQARRQFGEKQPSTQTALDTNTPFAYVAGVLTQETFVLLNRTMQKNLDDKAWPHVHTCLLAFTRILLTVSAMSESPSEDDQEVAENIQNRMFYEEQTHDRILQVLRTYQDGRQSFPYLDACTELAHVFIRLLERYSKVNVDMYIRSKRRARKTANAKPKGTATVEGLEENEPQQDDEAAEDKVEAFREVQERKFDFSKFAAKFVNEASINTFLALLRKYRDLTEDQLKRCHRFLYRVAFKMDLPILLYRVDILNLFNKLIQGPNGLDGVLEKKGSHFKEWEELVRQIFRRCIKKVEERPELIVEMLFTKIPSSIFFLEHGYEKEVTKSAPRAPAEVEVKPGMDHMQQLGVAVGVLVDQGKLDALAWVKTILIGAVEERRSWEDLNLSLDQLREKPTEQSTLFGDGSNSDHQAEPTGPSTDEVANEAEKPSPPSIIINPDSEERRVATFKDKHLRLLLKTLGFQRLGLNDDPDAKWNIPSTSSASSLEDDLDAIRKFEFEPPVYEDGKSAEAFLRSVAAARRNAYEKDSSEDEGDSEVDEGLFVSGGPTRRPDDPRDEKPKRKRLRRKGEEITEEEREARALAKRMREKEKDAKVKSTLFVTESDDEDDEDKDAEFFRLEEQRRGTAAHLVKAALMDGRTGHGEERASKKRKSEGGKPQAKRSKASALLDLDEDDRSDEDVDVVISSRENSPGTESSMSDSEEEVAAEEMPMSSQTGKRDVDIIVKEAPLRPISGNEQKAGESDGEEDMPVKTARRTNRQMFVIDDDSD